MYPIPQSVELGSEGFAIAGQATLVAGRGTDASALKVVEAALRQAGVSQVARSESGQPTERGTGIAVYIGGKSEGNDDSARVLRALSVQNSSGLSEEGYVLAAGKALDSGNVVVLDGAGKAGTFYAAQTFRQLIERRHGKWWVPGIAVRDWPTMRLRGVIEGFYGPPWSHENRLRQLAFYGERKMNVYVYSPKDDPYLRDRWRERYPKQNLARIRKLVEAAVENHVEFTYALSPGLSICYSSDEDATALIDKFESLWDVGVRSFAIPLDDISYTKWNCSQDVAKFGTGAEAAGKAQAYVLNRVQRQFIKAHSGAKRLQMVPTEYDDLAYTPYKQALREQLDPAIVVEWTGVGVIAPVITSLLAEQARKVYGHDILIWDNYPVNDYVKNRLLLGPIVGRDPDLGKQITGITANPMVQAEASKIAEFTEADYYWNGADYEPTASWTAALREIGGSEWRALKVFAENNYSSRINSTESPALSLLIERFWGTYDDNGDLSTAASELSDYFAQMRKAPSELRQGLKNQEFLREVEPWLDKLGLYGDAGGSAVRTLLARRKGNSGTAVRERQKLQNLRKQIEAIPQIVAPGVMDPFLDRALSESTSAREG